MSSRRPTRHQDDPEAFAGEGTGVGGLCLTALGAAWFLALASYTPDDLPSWVKFSTISPANDPVHNLLGPAGAVLAGYSLFLFGVASFLIPFCLIWMGLARTLLGMKLLPRPLAGMSLFVLGGSAFMGMQSLWFQNWWAEYNILGAGGGIGWIAQKMAQNTIGRPLGMLVALFGYGSGLVLMTGVRPAIMAMNFRRAWFQIVERLTGRHAGRIRTLEAEEALSLLGEQRKTERERKRLERELKLAELAEASGATHIALDPSGSLALDDLENETLAAEAGAPIAAPKKGRLGKRGLTPEPADEPDEDEALLTIDTDGRVATAAQVMAASTASEPEIINGSRRNQPTGEPKLSLAEWRSQQNRTNTTTDGPAPRRAAGTPDFSHYVLPPLSILNWDDTPDETQLDETGLRETQRTIIRTLESFGIDVAPGPITRGPTISRFEIYPSEGLRVNRITALEADLARATKAERINILAPIPGKDTVGIEIANNEKVAVPLRELLEDDSFAQTKMRLPLALGKDVYGNTIVADLAAMPHLLVAGATGSGKSVCINSIIGSLLFQFSPEQLRFIMIDPKVVEMQTYNALPHLVVPVVTDPKKVIMALRWVVNEMEHRYRLFAAEGVRNFETFNARKPKARAEVAAKEKSAARGTQPGSTGVDPNGTMLLPLFDEPTAEELPESLTEDDITLSDNFPNTSATTETDADADIVEVIEFADEDENEDETIVAEDEEDDDSPPWEETPVARSSGLAMHRVSLSPGMAEEDEEEDAMDDDLNVWDDSQILAEENPEDDEDTIPDHIPYIVVIIDELADLMQTAPADMEQLIQRITQKARAAGIHMILATQSPRAEVITGIIKANTPCRIAFQVSSALDSRVILDTKGAEKLVGKGDMLYLPPGSSKLIRAQGAFVTDDEIAQLVQHCNEQAKPTYDSEVQKACGEGPKEIEKLNPEDEDTLERCIEVIMVDRKASTSLLQRRLRLGYGRAARMMDLLEQRGFIGPGDGAKPREVLVAPDDDEM